jgi:hypothetical protein
MLAGVELIERWSRAGGSEPFLAEDVVDPAGIGAHPDALGVVVASEAGAWLGFRADLDEAGRAQLLAGAVERVERLREHGPEPDSWQLRESDGAWQLWLRLVELPPL